MPASNKMSCTALSDGKTKVAYQLSSDKSVLPLPQISLYTNMYLKFKVAKVLMVQLGANMYYNTSYYAPYYEPATQQFQIQDEVKVEITR